MLEFIHRHGGEIIAGLTLVALTALGASLARATVRWGPSILSWLVRPVRVPPAVILALVAAFAWIASVR